jgi:hypothetical protein
VVGFTTGSREKVPGKTYEKRIRNNNNNNNNNRQIVQIMELLIIHFLPPPCHFNPLYLQVDYQHYKILNRF